MTNQVLLLSVGFQPIARLPWEVAIVHVLIDKVAEIVDEVPGEFIHTSNWAYPMPSVIRLLKPVPRKKALKFSRSNVFLRDRGVCQYCGIKVKRDEFTYDHVIPRRLGGTTIWGNVVTSCISCNQRKGGRTPEQAGMHLRNQPVKPKKLSDANVFDMPWRPGMPESWRSYLRDSVRDSVYWTGTLEED